MHAKRHVTGISAAFVLLAALSGCVLGTTDLDGQDREAVFPTLRATVPLSGGGEWEFGVSQGGGTFSNGVPAGNTLDFGGMIAPGPDTVTTDIDLRVWQALIATSSFDENTPPGIAPRVLVGFNWIETDLP